MRGVQLLIFLCLNMIVQAQEDQIFSYQAFIDQVKTHHPIAYQAKLLDEKSAAYAMKAKGEFDPKLEMQWNEKSFDQKNYFQQLNTALKIPTWFGPDLKLGYESNTGQFLNNSDVLPRNGLMAGGISVPLGKGLLFDERRKALAEAKLIRQANDLKQRQVLNKMIFAASKSYLKWQVSFQMIQIQQDAVDVARQRFDNTVLSFQNGDIPAIDTLEALVNWRTRQQGLIQHRQDYQAARQHLQNYLWLEGFVPLELETIVQPEALEDAAFEQTVARVRLEQNQLLANNPNIRAFALRDLQFKVERKWLREALRPTANFSFNPLLRLDNPDVLSAYAVDDYKLGIDFFYPLFTRKERASIKLADINIKENTASEALAKARLTNELINLFTQDETLQQQLQIVQNNVIAYRQLLDAENEKLQIGESSMFLINARESKLIEVQRKALKLQEQVLVNRLEVLHLTQVLAE